MPNPERFESPPGTAPAVLTAIDITEAIETLPAVATIDWCDRAAAAVARLVRSGIALVVIAQVDESGRIVSQEATGVAVGRQSGAERARGVAKVQPRLVRETDDAAPLDAVRVRAEKLSHLGWTPDRLSQPAAGVLGTLPGGRHWRNGPAGRLWGEAAQAEVLAGMAPVGDAEYGRVLLVQISPTPPALPEAEDAVVLRAVLPVLARRALLALGPLRTNPGQWLTTREQAVLDQLVVGRSVKQIAEGLGRSTHTVHGHVKSLHRKLGASSRGELIARALGYLPANPARTGRGGFEGWARTG
jgi:DNA-binding CsgD family transcriptional regulator